MIFGGYLWPWAVAGTVFLLTLAIWDLVWKGLGMWHAGRNNQIVWFVCILLFNTVGILPIVYLLWFQKKEVRHRRRR